MATRQATGVWTGRRTHKWTVSGILATDISSTHSGSRLSDKTVQVLGTFGVGGVLSIEGSNDGGTTWNILNDTRGEGNPLTFNTAGGSDIRSINENPDLIRANCTAGDGATNLTVIIVSSSVAS